MNTGILVSWHYLRRCVSSVMPYVGRIPVVLDSGAFSAASSGKPISILEYAGFLRSSANLFDWCASLDVIGNPAQSFTNWNALRVSHHGVVPCVHCGTDLRWLKQYIDEGVPRIAFGGLVPHSKTLRHTDSTARKWLDAAFSVVQGTSVAVHGFGVTGRPVVFAYPWTTVDSSLALAKTRFREVIQSDGRALSAEQGVQSAHAVRMLADPWEVRSGSPTRRARLTANLFGADSSLRGSTLETLYHAVPPSNSGSLSDFATVIKHILNGADKARSALQTEAWNP